MDAIKGEYLGHYSVTKGGFVYRFQCSRCNGFFLEIVDEVSAPSLCHDCYISRNHGSVITVHKSTRKGTSIKDD